ncbi:unnamed protein product [Closterium sp. NIES-65]|nr:unnamed protein product [Closterium sp. NIES-65]
MLSPRNAGSNGVGGGAGGEGEYGAGQQRRRAGSRPLIRVNEGQQMAAQVLDADEYPDQYPEEYAHEYPEEYAQEYPHDYLDANDFASDYLSQRGAARRASAPSPSAAGYQATGLSTSPLRSSMGAALGAGMSSGHVRSDAIGDSEADRGRHERGDPRRGGEAKQVRKVRSRAVGGEPSCSPRRCLIGRNALHGRVKPSTRPPVPRVLCVSPTSLATPPFPSPACPVAQFSSLPNYAGGTDGAAHSPQEVMSPRRVPKPARPAMLSGMGMGGAPTGSYQASSRGEAEVLRGVLALLEAVRDDDVARVNRILQDAPSRTALLHCAHPGTPRLSSPILNVPCLTFPSSLLPSLSALFAHVIHHSLPPPPRLVYLAASPHSRPTCLAHSPRHAPRAGTGRAALHEAVVAGSVDAAAALLEWGADPDGGHASQMPPILLAVQAGSEKAVTLLLSHGADINAHDAQLCTALHYACADAHRYPSSTSPLATPCPISSVPSCLSPLCHLSISDAPVLAPTCCFCPPFSGGRGMIKLLLVAGANMYARNSDGLLPQQLASTDRIRALFSKLHDYHHRHGLLPPHAHLASSATPAAAMAASPPASPGGMDRRSPHEGGLLGDDSWDDQGVPPLPCSRSTPLPCSRSTPLPCSRSTPLPCSRSTPLPCSRSTPLPCSRSTPLPCSRSTPLPCSRSTPLPCSRSTPLPCSRSTPLPCSRSTPLGHEPSPLAAAAVLHTVSQRVMPRPFVPIRAPPSSSPPHPLQA